MNSAPFPTPLVTPKRNCFLERFAIHYAQGPLLSRKEWDNSLVPEYESLGIYRTGIAEKGAPEGIMPGTSAIVRTSFEKGRVFVFSPHPEMTQGLGHMVERAVHWAAKREATGETNAATKSSPGQNAARQR